MGVGSEIIVKLLTVHPLLLVGVGKATAKLMGAGSGVNIPTVHSVLLVGACQATAKLMGASIDNIVFRGL